MSKKLFVIWLILGMMAGCANASDQSKESDIRIVVTSDIHYLNPSYYKECDWFEDAMLKGDGKMVTHADEILDAFQKDMEKQMEKLRVSGNAFRKTHICYRGYSICKKVFPPSIIFYIVKEAEQEIHILRVLREERDWEKILLRQQKYTYP